ncbi:MAG: Lrp/AsnC family transcriptional regulator [Rubrivivax sp.]|nr:Lrp/AsnC family transcriptional regulator [Rubrivivax sp.]
MAYESLRDLDRVDLQILEALQSNGRLTMAELGEKVSLSPSPCWRRVQLLERGGFIVDYRARLDRRMMGLDVHGFVSVRMENHAQSTSANFERLVVALPEVIACQNLSGQYDYQLELVAPDHESFAQVVREKIRSLPGVKDIYTSFTLKEVKTAGALPVQL